MYVYPDLDGHTEFGRLNKFNPEANTATSAICIQGQNSFGYFKHPGAKTEISKELESLLEKIKANSN
jgi:hypothetical protein